MFWRYLDRVSTVQIDEERDTLRYKWDVLTMGSIPILFVLLISSVNDLAIIPSFRTFELTSLSSIFNFIGELTSIAPNVIFVAPVLLPSLLMLQPATCLHSTKVLAAFMAVNALFAVMAATFLLFVAVYQVAMFQLVPFIPLIAGGTCIVLACASVVGVYRSLQGYRPYMWLVPFGARHIVAVMLAACPASLLTVTMNPPSRWDTSPLAGLITMALSVGALAAATAASLLVARLPKKVFTATHISAAGWLGIAALGPALLQLGLRAVSLFLTSTTFRAVLEVAVVVCTYFAYPMILAASISTVAAICPRQAQPVFMTVLMSVFTGDQTQLQSYYQETFDPAQQYVWPRWVRMALFAVTPIVLLGAAFGLLDVSYDTRKAEDADEVIDRMPPTEQPPFLTNATPSPSLVVVLLGTALVSFGSSIIVDGINQFTRHDDALVRMTINSYRGGISVLGLVLLVGPSVVPAALCYLGNAGGALIGLAGNMVTSALIVAAMITTGPVEANALILAQFGAALVLMAVMATYASNIREIAQAGAADFLSVSAIVTAGFALGDLAAALLTSVICSLLPTAVIFILFVGAVSVFVSSCLLLLNPGSVIGRGGHPSLIVYFIQHGLKATEDEAPLLDV
ncbi:hypothetical protein J8273_0254 [Carpediemonas membranifera]|uniref:Uncharacterized protein n=1 Tax=Carpediemonas membranifera TaxID=201153 RepID=A0A8J6B8P3_9EUKA|nr:hypothetical protein J8273_0254 [Carpediemonas membranifera]|eukprot:KAG9395042.1 hypothetical protein J8273_0254 [Carpediemonas membranifera]